MSNRAVIDYVRPRLDPHSWAFTEYPHAEGKVNLVAQTNQPVRLKPKIPGGREPGGLALVCHTDTVPFDPAWSEAVHPAERDGNIYGRGSADVKGFLACILAAVSALDLSKLSEPLSIVLTADEEIGCIGARHLGQQNLFQSRCAIIGEPTSLTPIRAGKGYALASIVVHGKEAHSAFPASGRSAIYDAARVLAALEQVARELESHRHPDFDPPYTTLNVGLIEGGTAKNIVPGECRLTLEWRPTPGQSADFAASLITRKLEPLGIPLDFVLLRADPPFDPSPSTGLAGLITSLTGNAPGTVSFGTEAAHLHSLAKEVIVFGPGSMSTAHKSGEHVPIAELDRCVEILQSVIARYCLTQFTS